MTKAEARGARTDALLLTVLGVAVLLAFVASLLVGRTLGSAADFLALLFEGGDAIELLIFQEVRLPRALLALMIGATLGLCGAAMQGFLRNPLAEPGIVGVSASASFGAVIAFYFGLASLFPIALPLGGMIGAGLGVLTVQLLAGRGGSPLTFILAGVAVTSFAGALTALALNMAKNPFAAMEIMFWLMGSLNDRSFDHVWLAAPFMLAGWALLLTTGRALDALTLGEETAATLGFDLAKVQNRLILGTALSVGAATAVAGAIGFVGLVVPHLLRRFVGNRPSALLPASALGGAALLLTADVAVRLLSPERELKLGVLTALIGAPFFLYLILRERGRIT